MVDAVTASMKDFVLDIGRYETGQRIILPVPGVEGSHWVVAGSTHSGKTETCRLALAQMTVKFGKRVAFLVIDPHLVGFMDFLPRASTIVYGYQKAPEGLELAEVEMHRRLRLMHQHRIRFWTPEVADALGPWLVILVDEVAAITLAPKPKDGKATAEERLISLAQQSRKTGMGLMLAAQSPKVKVLNGFILEQCPIRWCGRTRRAEQTEAVLETRDYPCHLQDHPKGLPLHLPGTAYIDNGLHVRRGRSDGIKADVFAHIAADYAADRFDFGWPHEIHPVELADAREGTTA